MVIIKHKFLFVMSKFTCSMHWYLMCLVYLIFFRTLKLTTPSCKLRFVLEGKSICGILMFSSCSPFNLQGHILLAKSVKFECIICHVFMLHACYCIVFVHATLGFYKF
ncbi:hypothetical protein AMTRI_Chr13g121710 [Amborella trichopoda]